MKRNAGCDRPATAGREAAGCSSGLPGAWEHDIFMCVCGVVEGEGILLHGDMLARWGGLEHSPVTPC